MNMGAENRLLSSEKLIFVAANKNHVLSSYNDALRLLYPKFVVSISWPEINMLSGNGFDYKTCFWVLQLILI